jgi:hypothetical protein
MHAPFKLGWWSFDLGTYRPCDGTYCFYAYESVPPLPEPDGSLRWLGPLDEATDRKMEIHRNAPEARGMVAEIEAQARGLGLTLPGAFVRLMGSPELQDRIPSCTACYFSLSQKIVPCPASDGGYIVRFLNDQQDVLLWYLYLTPAGESGVLVSPIGLDDIAEEMPGAALTEEWRRSILANTFVCAPSFAAFIYRFWLENTLWFKLNEGEGNGTWTEEERRYLAHYARQRADG